MLRDHAASGAVPSLGSTERWTESIEIGSCLCGATVVRYSVIVSGAVGWLEHGIRTLQGNALLQVPPMSGLLARIGGFL